MDGERIQIMMSARVLSVVGGNGWQPSALGAINPFTLLAPGLPPETLARMTGPSVLAVFSFINLPLLRIKGRDPHPEGVRNVPTRIPWYGFLASTAFVFYPMLIVLVGHPGQS